MRDSNPPLCLGMATSCQLDQRSTDGSEEIRTLKTRILSAGCLPVASRSPAIYGVRGNQCEREDLNLQDLVSRTRMSASCITFAKSAGEGSRTPRNFVLSEVCLPIASHRQAKEGAGLEPATEWIPLLVFKTSSSSSRTPSKTVTRGVEPPQDISPGRLATCCHTIRRRHRKAGVPGFEPGLAVLETARLP